MSPERWQQVRTTLAAALELPTHRTGRVPRSQCGDDTSLRREVESLLAQPEDEFESVRGRRLVRCTGTSFHGGPGGGSGAYELVRELGRGGMGAVWLARRADQQFEKLVAIKLLKRGTDTDEVLRRSRPNARSWRASNIRTSRGCSMAASTERTCPIS